MTAPLLVVEDLVKVYPVARGLFGRIGSAVRAVDGVSFSIAAGETLGLVGESGCGKSTLARCILRLIEPSGGHVSFAGADVAGHRGEALRRYHQRAGMVFQDPFGSLNPRQMIGDMVGEPLRAHHLVGGRRSERARVGELLDLVGLDPGRARSYPRQLSGGQRQRVAIARAIASEPELLILDEPVASLDVSVGAQILNLLADLQTELGVAYLFISHNLSVVRHVAHRTAVMYLGSFLESGPTPQLFDRPQHPYTQALLSAVSVPDPDRERERPRIRLTGEVSTSLDVPTGCRFHTRCFRAETVCSECEPMLDRVGPNEHRAACLFPGDRVALRQTHAAH
ncbi:MAG: ATP-binding cassette domain-containing protein [Acidimicrobiia bacterium]|nr:ATP-binding cassette domain-containing protein [Acidimicrobiia bacterium]